MTSQYPRLHCECNLIICERHNSDFTGTETSPSWPSSGHSILQRDLHVHTTNAFAYVLCKEQTKHNSHERYAQGMAWSWTNLRLRTDRTAQEIRFLDGRDGRIGRLSERTNARGGRQSALSSSSSVEEVVQWKPQRKDILPVGPVI